MHSVAVEMYPSSPTITSLHFLIVCFSSSDYCYCLPSMGHMGHKLRCNSVCLILFSFLVRIHCTFPLLGEKNASNQSILISFAHQIYQSHSVSPELEQLSNEKKHVENTARARASISLDWLNSTEIWFSYFVHWNRTENEPAPSSKACTQYSNGKNLPPQKFALLLRSATTKRQRIRWMNLFFFFYFRTP